MMQPPQHLVDEVLSAHADGVLTGAEAVGAEQHLASCTECAERLGQLEGARAAMRAPVPPVDDLTRQRLLRRAIEVERRHARLAPRSPRWLTAAAAAAVALGAVSFLAVRDGGDSTPQAVEVGGIGGLPLSEEFIATDVGPFDDPEALRLALESAEGSAAAGRLQLEEGGAQGPGAAAGGGSATDEAVGAVPTTVGPEDTNSDAAAPDEADSGDQLVEQSPPQPETGEIETPGIAARQTQRSASVGPSDAYAAIARCYSSLTDQLPRDGRLVAAATGTYAGQAAIAMGFRTADGERLLAVILAWDDCSIVTAQSYR